MKKNILFAMIVVLALSSGCEKQKQVPKQDEIELSFEYKELGGTRVAFRNTSTPDYILQGDMWYYFSTTEAPAIGDGSINLSSTGITTVSMLYKPALQPEPNDIYVWRNFEINLTGIADTAVWIKATPTTPTQIP